LGNEVLLNEVDVLILYFIFKSVISGRDVTLGIRAKVFKMFLGSLGSELIALRLCDRWMCFMLIFDLYSLELSCVI